MNIGIDLALVAYALVLLAIAFLSSRGKGGFGSFVLADRGQPGFLIIASMLASTIGGGLTLGTVSKAFKLGFPAFWFVASGSLAHLLQGFFLSEKVRSTEALTLPDLAEKLSCPSVRRLSGMIIVLTWIGIAAAQFLAAAKVVSSFTGIAHPWAVVATASFLVVYTVIGGQKSILRTDLFQFGILAIAVLATLAWLYGTRAPSIQNLDIHIFSSGFGPLDLAYYLVVVAGSYLICPMMFGRILSSKSPTEARRASFVSAAGMLAFAFAITFIGLWARAWDFDPGKLDPLNALIRGVLPPWLGWIMAFGILAAILSTADTVLLTAAGVFEHDVRGASSSELTKSWVGLVAFVGALIALYQTDIVDLLLKTYQGYTSGIVPALFIATLAYPRRRVKPQWLFAAIITGYALGFGGGLLADPTAQKILAFAGLAASSLISLIGLVRKTSIEAI